MTSLPHQELLARRDEFPILAETTYLISNSLGAMPRAVEDDLARFTSEWRRRGVRAWEEGWWEAAVTVGDLLAPILGVAPGEIAMHQNLSLSLSVFLSALDYPPHRNRLVLSDREFHTVHYVCEGERRRGAELIYVPSADGLAVDAAALLAAIDERTRVVVVSHVFFRNAQLIDPRPLAARCREVGALLVLDVYQSAGAVPMALAEWGVDAAVGGSVKWLCGGPGAGYLWVRPELAETLEPRLTGWQADEEPFAFRPGPIRRARGAYRLLTGSPNVPALFSCRAGYRIVGEIGVETIRARSLGLTQRLLDGADELGLEVRSPRPAAERGGHVTLWHPDGARLCRDLAARQILCDFRPGAGLRLGPHFYNSAAECDRALDALAELGGK